MNENQDEDPAGGWERTVVPSYISPFTGATLIIISRANATHRGLYRLAARQFTSRATTAAAAAGGTISTTSLLKSVKTAPGDPTDATCPPAFVSVTMQKGSQLAASIPWL